MHRELFNDVNKIETVYVDKLTLLRIGLDFSAALNWVGFKPGIYLSQTRSFIGEDFR